MIAQVALMAKVCRPVSVLVFEDLDLTRPSQLDALVFEVVELAATAGDQKVLGVESNLDMGPKVWQPLAKGLADMAKNPQPYLEDKKAIFPGRPLHYCAMVFCDGNWSRLSNWSNRSAPPTPATEPKQPVRASPASKSGRTAPAPITQALLQRLPCGWEVVQSVAWSEKEIQPSQAQQRQARSRFRLC